MHINGDFLKIHFYSSLCLLCANVIFGQNYSPSENETSIMILKCTWQQFSGKNLENLV